MSTRDVSLIAARAVLGGYLAAHGAQKLFGWFGGRGMAATVASFDRMGLRPAPLMARVAAVSELAGGALTAAGAAYPLGPVALAGTMSVAASTHRANGPFAANGGFELPLTNMAAALALAVAGPGRYSIDALSGRSLPRPVVGLVAAGAAAAAAGCLTMVLRTRPEAPSTAAGSERRDEVDETNGAGEGRLDPGYHESSCLLPTALSARRSRSGERRRRRYVGPWIAEGGRCFGQFLRLEPGALTDLRARVERLGSG
jgi:putative oxidoreductase